MKRTKVDGPAMRVCVHCHQEKKIAQFSRDPSGPDGRQTWCMICMKVRLQIPEMWVGWFRSDAGQSAGVSLTHGVGMGTRTALVLSIT